VRLDDLTRKPESEPESAVVPRGDGPLEALEDARLFLPPGSRTLRGVFGAGGTRDLPMAAPAMPDLYRVTGGPVGENLTNGSAIQDFDKLEPEPFGRTVGPSASAADDDSGGCQHLSSIFARGPSFLHRSSAGEERERDREAKTVVYRAGTGATVRQPSNLRKRMHALTSPNPKLALAMILMSGTSTVV
jgi:hypothetical protein